MQAGLPVSSVICVSAREAGSCPYLYLYQWECVTLSWSHILIDARFMGAAPLYCGSSEACRWKVPSGGMLQTSSGSIRKATTTTISIISLSAEIIPGHQFFRLKGVSLCFRDTLHRAAGDLAAAAAGACPER